MLIAQQQIPAAYITWIIPLVVIGVLVQLGFGSIISLVLWRMSSTQRKFERMEDDRNARIAGLKERVAMSEQHSHELVEKLVEERFRTMSHKIDNEVNGFLLTLQSLMKKVEQTEADLDSTGKTLGERDHAIEKETLLRVGELHRVFLETGASKADLKEQDRKVDQKLDRMEERVGRLAEVVATRDDLERIRKEQSHG